MYQDYLDDIIRYYRKEASNGSLPQRLIRPTPANIKEECQFVCQARFEKKDLRVLPAFFTGENDQESILKAIKRCDRDKFKPLCNFLNGKTSTPVDLNIELLAWLIDFPNRPFRSEDYIDFPGMPASMQNEIQSGAIEAKASSDQELNLDDVGMGTVNELDEYRSPETKIQKLIKHFKERKRVALIIAGIVLPTLLGFYFIIDSEMPSGIFNSRPQKCMIWVGDHYVPSSCEPRRGDTVVIAFDATRIKNFKRINQPDTITLLSENKIWYIKRNGVIEYYTAGGRHPVDPNRVLKPLSRYMILKYKNSPQ